MVILIDIGNTRIKILFPKNLNGLKHAHQMVIDHEDSDLRDLWREVVEYSQQSNFMVQGVVIGSVKPSVLTKLISTCPNKLQSLLYIAKTERAFGNLRNSYKEPSKLGVDRWLAMISASLIGTQAAMIIDLGTAITVDVVGSNGCHLGGYICPGLKTQVESLLKSTESVTSKESQDGVINQLGKDTEDCVVNGVLTQINDFVINQINQAFNLHKVRSIFITGGDAERFSMTIKESFGERLSLSFSKTLVFEGLLTMFLKEFKKN